jgi:hypothetical protein
VSSGLAGGVAWGWGGGGLMLSGRGGERGAQLGQVAGEDGVQPGAGTPAFRWPTAREDENLSTLRQLEALHERGLRVL